MLGFEAQWLPYFKDQRSSNPQANIGKESVSWAELFPFYIPSVLFLAHPHPHLLAGFGPYLTSLEAFREILLSSANKICSEKMIYDKSFPILCEFKEIYCLLAAL